MLKPINFFLYCLGFRLVHAFERVDQLDLFDHEHFARIDVNSFVHFTSGARTEQLPLLPLNGFPIDPACLHLIFRLLEEIVFLLE